VSSARRFKSSLLRRRQGLRTGGECASGPSPGKAWVPARKLIDSNGPRPAGDAGGRDAPRRHSQGRTGRDAGRAPIAAPVSGTRRVHARVRLEATALPPAHSGWRVPAERARAGRAGDVLGRRPGCEPPLDIPEAGSSCRPPNRRRGHGPTRGPEQRPAGPPVAPPGLPGGKSGRPGSFNGRVSLSRSQISRRRLGQFIRRASRETDYWKDPNESHATDRAIRLPRRSANDG